MKHTQSISSRYWIWKQTDQHNVHLTREKKNMYLPDLEAKLAITKKISVQLIHRLRSKMNLPKLIDSDDSEMLGKSIKIPEKETLRSSISMNHNQGRGIIFTIKSNRVDKPWLVAWRSKPPDFRPGRTRTYINLFLNIRSSAKNSTNTPINRGHINTKYSKCSLFISVSTKLYNLIFKWLKKNEDFDFYIPKHV